MTVSLWSKDINGLDSSVRCGEAVGDCGMKSIPSLAARFGEVAITEYSHWHTPSDSFLSAIVDEVESMKSRTWIAP